MANEIGVTEVGATSQDIVASIVQETLKQESLLIPTILDYSLYAGKGAQSVKIPRRNQFTAADKVENTDLTAQELTFAVDTITLNKNKAIYSKLERIAELQAMPNVEAEILIEMAKELALQIDKDIIVELKLASSSAPDHILDYVDTATNVIADADILEARRLLNVQKVPQTDRFLLIGPDKEKQMLSIANFIEQDKYGPNVAIMKGELGMVRGFRVIMHTELEAINSIFYHKSAVGMALQLAPEFSMDKQLRSTSKEYLLQQIYGLEVLDSGKRQVFFNGTGS